MSADSVLGALGLPADLHPLTRLPRNSTEPEAMPKRMMAASESSLFSFHSVPIDGEEGTSTVLYNLRLAWVESQPRPGNLLDSI